MRMTAKFLPLAIACIPHPILYGRSTMSENDIKEIARLIAEELAVYQSSCSLTQEEQAAVRDLIKTKKKAVKAALFLFGALLLWILKDVYVWIAGHLTLR